MRLFFYLLAASFLALCSADSMAQNKITIKGVIRDKNNNAGLAGVTISAGKPPKGIGFSNSDGAFTVSVVPGTELRFSFTGYETITRTVKPGTSSIEINMAPKDDAMTEVVVQGFKSQSRETTTGSSVVISGKDLQDVPVSNVVELLQGKVAGLNIQNNTGSPGGMGTINMRGLSSVNISSDGFLTPTSPLFVIDGVPVDLNTNYEYGFQGGGP